MTEKNSNCIEGIECPHCGSQGPFRVSLIVYGRALITDDGVVEMDREQIDFQDDPDWFCSACGRDFHP